MRSRLRRFDGFNGSVSDLYRWHSVRRYLVEVVDRGRDSWTRSGLKLQWSSYVLSNRTLQLSLRSITPNTDTLISLFTHLI
jgi:hypothetical protein